jgi:hypothetical protein
MNLFPSMAFIPGRPAAKPGLLARYLPPLPEGVVTPWLQKRIPPGAWVLDPFGMAPNLVAEAARAGYRVLVSTNNPVNRFLIELAARPPQERELSAALADLAATRKGKERLEPHLRSLYETICAQCEKTVMAEAFLWERESSAPYGRIYNCPYCGDAGERPANREDLEKATFFSSAGMHRARALERVVPHGDPDRAHVAEALSAYLPRALYALITLVNKLESLTPVSSEGILRHQHLSMLLLNACDDANTLWHYPTVRARPRQLMVPTRFRENNLWLSLERAVKTQSSTASPVPLVHWPEQPPTNSGVVVFEGRLKDLVETLRRGEAPDLHIDAVLGAFPRPNQAYWTLSALWAGWLWGREAVAPYKSVLRRRRYDWAWHTTALSAVLNHLAPWLAPGTPLLGLIGEAESGFLSASMIAAEFSNLDLEGLALRAGSGQAQISWLRQADTRLSSVTDSVRSTNQDDQIQETAAQAAHSLLQQRGEPASYVRLHTAALSALSVTNMIPTTDEKPTGDVYAQLHTIFERAFTYRRGFLHYGGTGKSLDVGQWWIQSSENFALPLADRVEYAVVDYLHTVPVCTLPDIDHYVCTKFPGLLTPDREVIQACLESYAVQDPVGSEQWCLHPQENREVRSAEVETVCKSLIELGERLGFNPAGDHPLVWKNEQGDEVYAFYVLVSSCFGEILTNPLPPTVKRWIVLPGGRAGLALYKINHNPYLKSLLEGKWQFLKFRHLRGLVGMPSLSRQNLDQQMQLDPLTDTAPQMRLL